MKTTIKAAVGLLLLVVICVPLVAQESKPLSATPPPPGLTEVFASEKLESSIYTNAYLGLRLPIPEGWRIVEDESKRAAMEAGKELLKPVSAEQRAQREKSISNTAILLALVQSPTVPSVQTSVLLAVEKLPRYSTISATAYVAELKKILTEGTTVKYTLDKDVREETINDLPFVAIDVSVTTGEVRVNQKYACQIRKDYALCFIETYGTEAQLAAIKQVVAGLTLK